MINLSDFVPLQGEMVQLLTRLVELESPSTEKAAVDRLGAYLFERLSGLGCAVETDPQSEAGNHLIARIPGRQNLPGILLLCHMDTVWDLGTLQRLPVRFEGERMYGPGVEDMKAGITIVLTVLEHFTRRGLLPARPVTLLITSDEETGSRTSRALIERLGAQAGLALCMEPSLPDGSLKTSRKGTGEIDIAVTGIAAHAGSGHRVGRNAIEELAHHILAVQRLTDYDKGTTTNVGLVSGGTRSNVVPDQALAVVDFRVIDPGEVARLEAWAAAVRPVIDGTGVTVTVSVNRPPMPRSPHMAAAFARVQALGEALGLRLTEGLSGGASDANFIAPLGIPILDGLGAVGTGDHSENEHIIVSSLPERAALLAAILTEWSD